MENSFIYNRPRKNHNFAFYKAQYFFVFSGDALFSPFFALFFVAAKLSTFESGVLLGLVPFFLFVGDFLCGLLSKSYKINLLMMRILCLLEAVMIFLCGTFTSFPALVVIISLASLSNGALFQTQDASSSICCKKEKKGFDSVRIYGSIAYCLALFLDYFFLKDATLETYSLIFRLSSFIFILAFLSTLGNKDYPDVVFAKTSKAKLHFDKNFLFFLIFYVLVNGAVNIAGYYVPLYLKELGLGDNEYSLFYSIRVVCEICIILPYHKFILPLFKSHKNCLIIGTCLLLLSLFMSVVVPYKMPLVALYNCFRGFGSGFMIVSGVGFLLETLGDERMTSGLALVSAITNLFSGVGNLVSPYVYTGSSFILLFGILLGIGLLGYVSLFFTFPKERNVPIKS